MKAQKEEALLSFISVLLFISSGGLLEAEKPSKPYMRRPD
jgi:hypothetical protein